MKPSLCSDLASLFLVLAPTVPACSITDIAGSLDAGVGGAMATGGSPGSMATTGGVSAGTGGDAQVTATGGVANATGGAKASGVVTGGSASGGTKASGVVTGGAASTSTQTASGGSAGTTLPTWSAPNSCVTGNENSLFVGTWEGYIQGSPIGDEASSLRLNIMGANSSGLCGTVTMGTTTAPVTLPPATDPTAWYPPNIPQQELTSRPLGPVLGFAYTIQNGQVAGQRTTFEVSYTEIMKSWCEIQTSYPQVSAGSAYGCLPAANGTSGMGTDQCAISLIDGGQQTVACSQAWFCISRGRGTCACDAAACTAALDGTLFDLLFNGNQAMGTFGADTVVFNRVLATP